MPTPIVVVLVLSFMLAGMLVAYDAGRSAEPTVCPECQHCAERRRDRERRADQVVTEAERFYRSVGLRTLPRPVAPAAAGGARAADAGDGSTERQRLQRILVAYDGSAAARRALELAVGLAASLRASLAVMSVVPLHPGRVPIDPCDNEEVHARELLEAKAVAAQQGVTVELAEPVGEPAQAIEQAAEHGGFDLVLVGSHRGPRWLRWLRGSVTAHVVAHCTRSVVLVR